MALVPLIFGVLALAAVVPTGWHASAQAPNQYVVNNQGDPGSGNCGDGDCTLREAITAANSDSGDSDITFSVSGTITPASGLPALTQGGTSILGVSCGSTPTVQVDGNNSVNGNGFTIASSNNVIRGLSITRFTQNGISIAGSPRTGNQILCNWIGVTPAGSDGGNNDNGVLLFGQGGGGPTNNEIRGNVIAGNGKNNLGAGVNLTGGGTQSNIVAGNRIGINAAGAAIPNKDGVAIGNGAQNNTVGGPNAAADRNVISANTAFGVVINGSASGNTVQGNYIGTDASGNGVGASGQGLGNGQEGVLIHQGASNNTVRGNVISGNKITGVDISGDSCLGASNNVVAGNIIGLNAGGTAAVPNGSTSGSGGGGGVLLEQCAASNRIGGTTAADRNVISGNNQGVIIADDNTDNNLVQGNYIGTNPAGTADMGNLQQGVIILATSGTEGPRGNTIGGTGGARNVISGNVQGVLITGGASSRPVVGNVIKGNFIGTAANGTSNLRNDQCGVCLVRGAQNTNVIQNRIAFNGGDGLRVMDNPTTGTVASRNKIWANGQLGIDFQPGGEGESNYTSGQSWGVSQSGTTNNGNFAVPVIQSATWQPDGVTVQISGTAPANSQVQIYTWGQDPSSNFGEGKRFRKAVTANAQGAWTVQLKLPSNTRVQVLAVNFPTRKTSEFSRSFNLGAP